MASVQGREREIVSYRRCGNQEIGQIDPLILLAKVTINGDSHIDTVTAQRQDGKILYQLSPVILHRIRAADEDLKIGNYRDRE